MKHFWVNIKKLRVFNDAHSARQVFRIFTRVQFYIRSSSRIANLDCTDVTRIWENQFRRTTDNMCQFTIYRENQTQLLAKQIEARITSSMLRGGLWKVEVFLDAKEDRGASCSVWTLGLTSF